MKILDDYNFILAIKDLKTIPKICKELEIDYTNLIKGRSTEENEKRVASILKLEILKAYCYIKGADKYGD